MWSDRIPPEQLREIVAKLHSVLPAPAANASNGRAPLRARATAEQAAELLQPEPGFAAISGAGGGRLLLHDPLATISHMGGYGVITGPRGTVRVAARGFDLLQAMLEAWGGPSGGLLAGFIAYDLAAELEDPGPPPPETFSFPNLYFGLYDSALAFDNDRWTLTGTDAWRGSDGLPHSSGAAADLLARAAGHVGKDLPEAPASLVDAPPPTLRSRPDRREFEAAVERIVASVHAGDIFQTNLCRCIDTRLEPGTEWQLYQRLQSVSPSRYEAFLRLNKEQAVLSISPELFLKVDARIVESSPIKGTRPRGASSADDQSLAAELLASEKDRAELAMIVDVVRNDLARVCETGSVEVADHARLMSLPTVHHLFSTVKGRLRAHAGPVDLLRAAFPAASISGAPKIEAIRVAMREEGQMRGPCMGALGWISLDGRLELSVAIRTAFVADQQVRYYAGCGITADSVPATEFAESRHKAAAFVRALGLQPDADQ